MDQRRKVHAKSSRKEILLFDLHQSTVSDVLLYSEVIIIINLLPRGQSEIPFTLYLLYPC